MKLILWPCFLFALLSLSGCSMRPQIPVGEIPQVTSPTSAKIHETKAFLASEIFQSYPPLPKSSEPYKRTRRVLARLLPHIGATEATYPLFVVEAGDDANAMAVNGSAMVVYAALLRKLTRDDQLAVVLGHELAHLVAQHGMDNEKEERSAWVQAGSVLSSIAAGVAVAYGGGSAAAVDSTMDITGSAVQVIGEGAFVLSYDRDEEREADTVGLMILAKAGYDPRQAVIFWSNADEILGEYSGPSFFQTHPNHSDRADALREVLPIALKYFRDAQTKKIPGTMK
jgi:predicted Zn-dependent protease